MTEIKTWEQRIDALAHHERDWYPVSRQAIDAMKDEIAELRAALAQPQQEPPKGYRLVPVEPTRAMQAAYGHHFDYHLYQDMIAAAPHQGEKG